MEHSILSEVSNKTLGSYLSKSQFGQELFFPKLFKWKRTPLVNFEVLIAASGNRIAGDVCSWNSTSPQKTRKIIGKLSGELAPIKLHRKMDEKDINQYNALKALNASLNEIYDLVFEDTDFCMNGCLARLEWMCLQALSRFAITLTASNSAGLVTETDIDFQLADANKEVCAAANRYWTTANSATSLPVTDITTICAEARAAGVKAKYILMNTSKFTAFAASDEVTDLVYSNLVTAGITKPSLAIGIDSVNAALISKALPQIIVVDSYVDIEDADHTQTGSDCWEDANGADRYVTFIPDAPVGSILHAPSPEETTKPKQVTQAKKSNVLISKWSTVDPTNEITKGEISAFPIIDRIAEMWSLDTESHTTWGA
jgi:hypothetical protein